MSSSGVASSSSIFAGYITFSKFSENDGCVYGLGYQESYWVPSGECHEGEVITCNGPVWTRNRYNNSDCTGPVNTTTGLSSNCTDDLARIDCGGALPTDLQDVFQTTEYETPGCNGTAKNATLIEANACAQGMLPGTSYIVLCSSTKVQVSYYSSSSTCIGTPTSEQYDIPTCIGLTQYTCTPTAAPPSSSGHHSDSNDASGPVVQFLLLTAVVLTCVGLIRLS